MRVVVGLGARSGVDAGTLRAAVDEALAVVGLRRSDVAAVATIDRRAGEEGFRALEWRIVAFPASELDAYGVPNRSATVAAAVGTGSVAEAAALAAAGPDARLLLDKRVIGGVTVAVAMA